MSRVHWGWGASVQKPALLQGSPSTLVQSSFGPNVGLGGPSDPHFTPPQASLTDFSSRLSQLTVLSTTDFLQGASLAVVFLVVLI